MNRAMTAEESSAGLTSNTGGCESRANRAKHPEPSVHSPLHLLSRINSALKRPGTPCHKLNRVQHNSLPPIHSMI
jgi:hypothetical protein